MTDLSIQFHNVSFAYDGATLPLIRQLSFHLTRGWTGIVGANGAGKSTVLKLAAGVLKAEKGSIIRPEHTIYCPQRTDTPPEDLFELIRALDNDAFKLKGLLGIADDWLNRWPSLSHGERKRAQIAVALWKNPMALAVDEPTNHLDVRAQDLLFDALSAFRGVGLLVSHDRNLLDNLCHQCLFIEPPDAALRPGSYSSGLRQAATEEKTVVRQRAKAKHDFAKLKREAAKRRDAASKANRKRSKRNIATQDHDAKEKINLARITGKDGSAGRQLNQLGGRLARAEKKLDGIRVKKRVQLGIWMPGARSRRNTLFSLPGSFIPIGENRHLHFPDMFMKPDDRIAITGPNGSGKSTLVRHILHRLDLPVDRVVFLPQEIDIRSSKNILAKAKSLPHERLGRMMTVVSCLGSTPDRLLESATPSPGEIRKVLLSIGIANKPHLIIMDEPTNHLDLPSIECLEQALSDCPCGLILVSHDRRFLACLADKEWRISKDESKKNNWRLECGHIAKGSRGY